MAATEADQRDREPALPPFPLLPFSSFHSWSWPGMQNRTIEITGVASLTIVTMKNSTTRPMGIHAIGDWDRLPLAAFQFLFGILHEATSQVCGKAPTRTSKPCSTSRTAKQQKEIKRRIGEQVLGRARPLLAFPLAIAGEREHERTTSRAPSAAIAYSVPPSPMMAGTMPNGTPRAAYSKKALPSANAQVRAARPVARRKPQQSGPEVPYSFGSSRASRLDVDRAAAVLEIVDALFAHERIPDSAKIDPGVRKLMDEERTRVQNIVP